MYTYLMIKPDASENYEIVRDVLATIKEHNLEILKFSRILLTKEILSEHYSHLVDKPFYPELEEFMTSGYVLPLLVKGENAVDTTRKFIGATNPAEAEVGTIREKYGNKEIMTYNVIHGSDSDENAIIEIKRFFQLDEEKLDNLSPLNIDKIIELYY